MPTAHFLRVALPRPPSRVERGRALVAASQPRAAVVAAPPQLPTLVHGLDRAAASPSLDGGWLRGLAVAPGERSDEAAECDDLSAAPPFTLSDIRSAMPDHVWERDTARSLGYLFRDVAAVLGLACGALALQANWWIWPLYALAQGSMFWSLFVVGHDCGHRSFSPSGTLNDAIGNVVHASILVPYHAWRISHRTHHSNHGHVEHDESWHPVTASGVASGDARLLGRFGGLFSFLMFPLYLVLNSPQRSGSHYDASNTALFAPSEKSMVATSYACVATVAGLLAASCAAVGPSLVALLYGAPYVVGVFWLGLVTYLHHHGPDDTHAAAGMRVPWYRGAEWSYLRGGLSTLDRDYGPLFNALHHNIGTHVVHHLFPQIPHYHLQDATQAAAPVMGPYYRRPDASPGVFPSHLVSAAARSFASDHVVADAGDVVFYERSDDASLPSLFRASLRALRTRWAARRGVAA